MFFFLLLIYSLSLFFFFFDLNIFFVNEELLIFICMCILFILLTSSIKKIIKFNFFFKIEFIYFFFIYLITLNIKLINKLLNYISLENLKLNSLILVEIYNFYNDSIYELVNSGKLINLFLTKNIILLLNSNFFFAQALKLSSNYSFNIVYINNNYCQYFELYDIGYSFLKKSLLSTNSFNILQYINLFYIYSNFYFDNIINYSNIKFIKNFALYIELSFFVKNLSFNLLK